MKKINKENINEVLKEIETAFYDIPFSNTEFQVENFIINSALTPQRAYRAIGLQLFDKISALKNASFDKQLSDLEIEKKMVEIEEIKEELTTNDIFDKYEIKQLNIDIKVLTIEIEKEKEKYRSLEKGANDAISEIQYLYDKFLKLPKYSRLEFEQGERDYFEKNLRRQLQTGGAGGVLSLIDMGSDPGDAEKNKTALLDNKLLIEDINSGNTNNKTNIINDRFPLGIEQK
jgi:hypothetical protein